MPDLGKQLDELKSEVAELREDLVDVRLAAATAKSERGRLEKDVSDLKKCREADRLAGMSTAAKIAIGTAVPGAGGGGLYLLLRLLGG